MSQTEYKVLSPEDIDHFVNHGWLKISNCFSRAKADEVCANIWNKLHMDPNDMSTWNIEWQPVDRTRSFMVNNIAPKAFGAICDLVGEDRLPGRGRNMTWDDRLIVNLGTPSGAGKDIGPWETYGWHVDGDFFVHFLDSGEQGLLVVPLWTDIAKSGGGTLMCPDAIPIIARHLYDHPEGVSPGMVPRGDKSGKYEVFYNKIAQSMPQESFLEMTGEMGDVYLLHPLMLHSVSNNKLRQLRIISNPPVMLREPFRLARADPTQYSVVELCTRRALGDVNLKKWGIKGNREFIRVNRDPKPEFSKSQNESGEDVIDRHDNKASKLEAMNGAKTGFLKGMFKSKSRKG